MEGEGEEEEGAKAPSFLSPRCIEVGNRMIEASVSSPSHSVPLWWTSVAAESQEVNDFLTTKFTKLTEYAQRRTKKLENHSN